MEGDAVHKIANSTGQSWSQTEIIELWEEYENHDTPESKIVHQLDKLDMLVQAVAYEERYRVDLSQFFSGLENYFEDPLISQWAKETFDGHQKFLMEFNANSNM